MTGPRIIAPQAFNARMDEIQARWDLPKDGFYWFPLVETIAVGVIAFESRPFYSALGAVWLRNTLAHHGVRNVVRVPEFLEMDIEVMGLSDATFLYAGFESYWIDERPEVLDWIVYLSHEESVTLGGASLLRDVKADWPEWSNHLWNKAATNYRPIAG